MVFRFLIPISVGFILFLIFYTIANMVRGWKKKGEPKIFDNVLIALCLFLVLMMTAFFSYAIGREILGIFFIHWR